MRWHKKIIAIGALALGLSAGGKTLADYTEYRENRDSLECAHRSPYSKLGSCSLDESTSESCNIDVIACQDIIRNSIPLLNSDNSFPFFKGSEYFESFNKYIQNRMNFKNALRIGTLHQNPERLIDMTHETKEFIQNLEGEGYGDTSLYGAILADAVKDHKAIVDQIERFEFTRYSGKLFLPSNCSRPENIDYDPQNPLSNEGLVSYMSCLHRDSREYNRRVREIRDELKTKRIEFCDTGNVPPSYHNIDTLRVREYCQIRKDSLMEIDNLERKIQQRY